MKKVFLGLGLLALFGTVMVGVSASAQRYHRYRTSKNYQRYGQKVRPVSPRIQGQDRYARRGGQTTSYTRRGTFQGTTQSSRNIKRVWRGRRYFRPELYRDYPTRYQNTAVNVEAEKLVPAGEFTFDNQRGFQADGGGIFRSGQTSFAFRVYEADGVCRKENFSRCVKNIMDQYRRRMGVTKLLTQDYSMRQTINDDFSYQLTYREMFIGRDRNIYYVMAVVNPNSGKMVRVEGVALSRDQKVASHTAHQVFESFRFIRVEPTIYAPVNATGFNTSTQFDVSTPQTNADYYQRFYDSIAQ